MSSYEAGEEGESSGVMCFRVSPHLLRGVVGVMMSDCVCGIIKQNTRVYNSIIIIIIIEIKKNTQRNEERVTLVL